MLTNDTQKAIYTKLGENIKQYREAAKIKQELLASYIGLTRISIVNIEQGKQKVQIHTLLEIAKYLQIPVAQLLEPLNELIVDEVNSKLEKRITKELHSDKTKDIDKIKEFVNFALTKNNTK